MHLLGTDRAALRHGRLLAGGDGEMPLPDLSLGDVYGLVGWWSFVLDPQTGA